MTNHRNKQNYRFRTWKFRDRCHLKGGVRQGCFLSLILNYLIQFIHFHSLYIMSHYYAKFKENPCVGTDASTPFNLRSLQIQNGRIHVYCINMYEKIYQNEKGYYYKRNSKKPSLLLLLFCRFFNNFVCSLYY